MSTGQILEAALDHLSIAQAPPAGSIEEELRWYFTHREAREPLGSNCVAMAQKKAERLPWAIIRPASAEVLLVDAERRHRIERVLEGLDADTVEVLDAAFDPSLLPGLYGLRKLSSIIMRLPEVKAAHRASRSGVSLVTWLRDRVAESQRNPWVREEIAGFLLLAQHRRAGALRAYLEMRRKVGR